MNNFDRAEMKHDLDKSINYYLDDNQCLRCNEEEAEPDDDYCEYCIDTIKHQNKSRFISEETY